MKTLWSKPEGSGPCAKQSVIAMVVCTNGQRFVSTNYTMRPQAVCPRAGMRTGEGYEMCRDICQQAGHAEVNALRLAGAAASGGTLYLSGHSYICESCQGAADAAGIARTVLVGSP